MQVSPTIGMDELLAMKFGALLDEALDSVLKHGSFSEQQTEHIERVRQTLREKWNAAPCSRVFVVDHGRAKARKL